MEKKKTMAERVESIREEKMSLVGMKKYDYDLHRGYHYTCGQGVLCRSGLCPWYKVTCSGCDVEHASKCSAKICPGTCYMPQVQEHGFGILGYCPSDRCSNMPPELIERDQRELQTFSVDDLIGEIKDTKPLDRNTHYIPVVEPYGKLAPGEIVRHPEAWLDLENSDGLCMIPATQIPIVQQEIVNALDVKAEDVFLPSPKKFNLRNYLGLRQNTEIILDFRVQDLLLAHYWARYVYDRGHGLKNIFARLKDLDIDYCVSVNFSVYDAHPMYHNYYNLVRTLISFVELQKYFGKNVILELNTNPFCKEVDDTFMKIIKEGAISTVHHNFQLNMEGELEWATLRHKLDKNLDCDEIILGGVGRNDQIRKYSMIMRGRRIYLSSTKAYLNTVLKTHASGRRWERPFPGDEGDEDELDLKRAFYYKDLYYANVDYYNKTLPHILWDNK